MADIRHHMLSIALINHVDEKEHLPRCKEAKMLYVNLSKPHRKLKESIYIALNKANISKRTGEIVWAGVAAKIAAKRRKCEP